VDTQNSENINGEKSGIDTDMAADSDHNILRTKTFNRELKSLVNRIVSNEEKPEEEDLQSLSESQLLQSLHKIFYRIKSLDEIESVHSSFNPFLIDTENEPASGITDYLEAAFNSLGISVYDILTFSINDRCFTSTYTELNPVNKTDIILNLKDNLFKQISEKESGYILTAREREKDSFLSKKFIGFDDEGGRGMLLFIRLSSIVMNLIKELNQGHEAVPLAEYLSPIIIFRLEEQGEGEVRNRIEVLKNELSIPLYLHLGRFIPSLDLQRYDDLDSLVSIVETLLNISTISEDLNGALIKISRGCDKEMIYEIKYMISRLKQSLHGQASIVRIKSDVLLIITHKKNMGIVQAVAADYNEIYDNRFKSEIISMEKRDEIPGILLKVCL
jgi:hypothetical protein